MNHAAHERTVIRPSQVMSGVLVLLGGGALLLAVVLPFLVGTESLYDLLMGLMFITLALLISAYLSLKQAWLRLRTSIVMDQTGIQLVIPTWAGHCCWPMQTARVGWNQIEGIACREVRYGPVAITAVQVQEFMVYTQDGSYTLAKAFCPRVQQVAEMIAHRAGVAVQHLEGGQHLGWWRQPGP